MLWLFQVVAQQNPVLVKVVPTAGELSEFQKTLLSAGVGALFGILGNIAMEYVKPIIEKRAIGRHLGDELVVNVGTISNMADFLLNTDIDTAHEMNVAMAMCGGILESITSDRFDRYFSAQKSLVYEIDRKKQLMSFYKDVETLRTLVREKAVIMEIRSHARTAQINGQRYIKDKRLYYRRDPSGLDSYYRERLNDPTVP